MSGFLRYRLCAAGCAALMAIAPGAAYPQILTRGQVVQDGAAPSSAPPAPRPSIRQTSNFQPSRSPAGPAAPAQASAGPSRTANCIGGAIGGGLLGGLLVGALGGSNRDVARAVAVGAGVGCALGYNWTPRDKKAFDDASQEMFDDPYGRQRELVTPDSNERLTLVSTGSTVENREMEFQHLDTVATPEAGAKVVSRPYRAKSTLYLRQAPSAAADSEVRGRFEANDLVEVVAFTPDGQWAMIGEAGVIVGYVAASDLAPLQATQTLRQTPTAHARPPVRRTARAAPAAPAAPPRVATSRVVASTQCKSLVATSGASQQKKEAKGCSTPSGRWLVA